MKAFFEFVLRQAAAFTATGVIWLISFFAFSQIFLLSTAYALVCGVVTYYAVKHLQISRDAKRHGLTRKEYKFISGNLKEAKAKVIRLQRALVQVRPLGNAKENFEILRTVKRIYTNTKREPWRFFKAEAFFYKHLDSLVEITEKYAYLSKQQVKSREMSETMRDSRLAIIVLGQTVNKDLRIMLNDDVDTLHFELDVAKKTLQKPKKTNGRVI
ncbi:5-bromo-4-chloroindolyl phosphate hydrolysis family protein [Oceanobacillus alkalisoli]|uniref:5-bromo-4-chloroindolyl phosphate hydrolysis family protein n=1 Tax=Oceanobacillus alkalisoli TaxID=2925113 RepID=UPI001EF0A70F|nr:5-bromo-4-chloroindolyl phosphate hydrolysis family protein [Oceanobacillus alkalisoli]MCF3944399.1 5-bromo-4-chloroindolyl phosphate hydrolysis family protein [Oceanobacillus alkalisoli]MCG5102140.1 5-bromo-4-chloroindolyl phosphate hydrolysis family protein [Oceanobacillus alkalisoli]